MRGDELLGVLSDRGVVRAVALHPRGVRAMPAAQAIKPRKFESMPSVSLEEALRIMTDNKVRYLPVFEGNIRVGVVSIGDVVKALLDRQTTTVENMAAYYGQS